MVEAHLISYGIRKNELFGLGRTRDSSFSAIAVYFPRQKMFVREDEHSGFDSGPLHLRYEVLIGEDAKSAYRELLATLRADDYSGPEKIQVSKEFVSWARAMNKARNPTSDITDLLDI